MKVPLLDLKAQLTPLRAQIMEALTQVVDSSRYILGPKVEELEKRISAYAGCRFGVGVSSGTDALLVSLMVLEVGPGHRVVTTPFSFFATAGVIARVGARPVFVDIDPHSFNLSPSHLEEFLAAQRGNSDIGAVIPVHLFGQMADMDPILETCRERGIPVVEDAAQALGARYPSKKGVAGAGSMGDTGCFSFFPSKNLGGMGDAGMVVTQDQALWERLSIFRTHGAKPKYYHRYVGGNFRLDPLQAAVLLVKLDHLESWHRARQANADRYARLFQQTNLVKNGHLELPSRVWAGRGVEHTHVFNQYVIRVREGRRDQLRNFLSQAQIGTEVYYPVPFHLQECFKHLGYRRGDFPQAEAACKEVLALPIYPELQASMQEYVVEKIAEFFKA